MLIANRRKRGSPFQCLATEVARASQPGHAVRHTPLALQEEAGFEVDTVVRLTQDGQPQRGPAKFLAMFKENLGAGEGARTLDPDLGKVVLYH